MKLPQIELDKVELSIPVPRDNKIRSVYNVKVEQKRNIIFPKIPGMEGSNLLDMGRDPIKIYFEGLISGENAKEDVEKIMSKFKAGSPLTFFADITGSTDVTSVLIEDFNMDDSSGGGETYKYSIVLSEYKFPKESETSPSSILDELKDSAKKTVEKEVDGLLDAVIEMGKEKALDYVDKGLDEIGVKGETKEAIKGYAKEGLDEGGKFAKGKEKEYADKGLDKIGF